VLTGLETTTVKRLRRELVAVSRQLERSLITKYRTVTDLPDVEAIGYRQYAEARAREILAQTEAQIAAIDAYLVEGATKEVAGLVAAAYNEGLRGAAALVSAYDAQLALTTNIPFRHVAAVIVNSAERLRAHGQDFIAEVQSQVIQGLVEGKNPRVVARGIREATGVLQSNAEMLARTEALSAQDDGRRQLYGENRIDYVQRIATQDDRICGDCADRAGNVYRVEEAPAALHPNDRCFNAPWTPAWHDLGLVDDEWMAEHAKDAQRRAAAAGHKRSPNGVAPFEKANGIEPPKPVWTPTGGSPGR